MPPQDAIPRWQRRRDARPGELLEQALVCFSEHGFEETTLAEIARRAGVTKGTIYHYFASKDDLFEHLITDLALPALEALAVAADAAGTDPADRLEAVIRQHWTILSTTAVRRIPLLMLRELPRRPDLAQRMLGRVGERVFGIYASIIADGMRTGVFIATDPRTAAQLCALPIVARTIAAAAPLPTLGDPQDFINAHCAAMRRWLRAGGPS